MIIVFVCICAHMVCMYRSKTIVWSQFSVFTFLWVARYGRKHLYSLSWLPSAFLLLLLFPDLS